MQDRKISILGCGWLGLPLAQSLTSRGASVKGSSTSDEVLTKLRGVDITPFMIDLQPDLQEGYDREFFDSDILISCLPPRRIDGIDSFYPAQIKSLLKSVEDSSISKVLFIGSTSIYSDGVGVVSEESHIAPNKKSGVALERAELLLQSSNVDVTILRLGGLIGYDRDPGRFLQYKREITRSGNAPVNLIHRDDVIAIIESIIDREYWGHIVNGVAPEHPTRREFYSEAARIGGFSQPIFPEETSDQDWKIVSSSRLLSDLNYTFKYPSPLDILNRE